MARSGWEDSECQVRLDTGHRILTVVASSSRSQLAASVDRWGTSRRGSRIDDQPQPDYLCPELGFRLARLAGLEPATGCLEGSCSVHLSYRRPDLLCMTGVACSTRSGRNPPGGGQH